MFFRSPEESHAMATTFTGIVPAPDGAPDERPHFEAGDLLPGTVPDEVSVEKSSAPPAPGGPPDEEPHWEAGDSLEKIFTHEASDVKVALGEVASQVVACVKAFLATDFAGLLSQAEGLQNVVIGFGWGDSQAKDRRVFVKYDKTSGSILTSILEKTDEHSHKTGWFVSTNKSSVSVSLKMKAARATNSAARMACQRLIDLHVGDLLTELELQSVFGIDKAPQPDAPLQPTLQPVVRDVDKDRKDALEQARRKWNVDEETANTVEGLLADLMNEEKPGEIWCLTVEEVWGGDSNISSYANDAFKIHYGYDPSANVEDGSEPNLAERKKQAVQELESAQEHAAKASARYPDFSLITEYSSSYDEQGKLVLGSSGSRSFFHDEDGECKKEPFADLIRNQVFKLLKYSGNFTNLVTSDLFIGGNMCNNFYYKASAKVPFMFTYYACPPIEKAQGHTCPKTEGHFCPSVRQQLMQHYLENPFNPALLVTYDPPAADLGVSGSPAIRTFHLKDLYFKFTGQGDVPNLLCVGKGRSRKSYILNHLFGVQFERLQDDAVGLFHNSVEMLFHSKSFACGFNVVDLQGCASEDHLLLELLLDHLPNALLLVQLVDVSYIKDVLGKLPEKLRCSLKERTFILGRFEKETQTTAARMNFSSNIVGTKNGQLPRDAVWHFGHETEGELFLSQLQKALKAVQEFVAKHCKQSQTAGQSGSFPTAQRLCEGARALTRRCTGSTADVIEVKGGFWKMSEDLAAAGQTDKFHKQMQVDNVSEEFMQAHQEMVEVLRLSSLRGDLSREKVFPFYTKHLQLIKVNKNLSTSSSLTKPELLKQKESLEKDVPRPSEVFLCFFNAYMRGRSDMCADLLSQVVNQYLPTVKKDREEIEKLKAESDANKRKLGKLQEQQKDLSELHELNKVIDKKMSKLVLQVESKVLDSDLFQREAKLYANSTGERGDLVDLMAAEFESGKALEIIDGDTNTIDFETLDMIFRWVYERKSINKSLMVITIMGPQSSGKSTLLNYLFGAKFHVSAGRCTKGLNAMLLRTDMDKVKEILILDSEGLFSIEKQDQTFDRKMAIFCLSVSNLLLFNVKGELGSEVQKVLEVAVYATNKIVQAKSSLRVPRIMFILRDQLEVDAANMQQAYTKLQNQMSQAAHAAGTTLENVLQFSDDPSDVICMFSSAFSPTIVNKNESFILHESQNMFRNQCSKLRRQILSFSERTSVQDNLVDWLASANSVWMAVQENEHISMIVDLADITNHKKLLKALDEFRRIMNTFPEEGDASTKNMAHEPHPHPLLSGVETENERRFIPPGERICVKLQERIAEMRKEQVGKRAATLEKLREVQESELQDFKNSLIQLHQECADELTKSWASNLKSLARNSVKDIIESIYDVNIAAWKKTHAMATIQQDAQKMLDDLKQLVCDRKRKKELLSQDEFNAEIQKIKTKDQENLLRRFQKNKEAKLDEAFRALNESMKSSYMQDGGSGRCCFVPLAEKDRKDTLLDRLDDSLSTELLKPFAGLREVHQDETWSYVRSRRDPEREGLKKQVRELESRMNQHKKSWKPWEWGRDDAMKMLEAEKKKLEGHDERKYQEVSSALENEMFNLLLKEFSALRGGVQECIKSAREFNSKSTMAEPFPEEAKRKLLGVFNAHLDLLLTKEKQGERAETLEQLAAACTKHDHKAYQKEFTQTYFNMLYDQVERNEKIQSEYIERELTLKAQEAQTFYELFNSQIDGVKDFAKMFVQNTSEALDKVLKKACVTRFTNEFRNISKDASRVGLIEMREEAFEKAGNDETGKKIIKQYMKDPLQLEKDLCKKRFDELKTTKIQRFLDEVFDQEAQRARSEYQQFFYELAQALRDKKVIVPAAEEPVKTFLSYLWATLLADFRRPPGTSLEDMKHTLEGRDMWEGGCSLPSSPRPFQMKLDPDDFKEFFNHDEEVLDLLRKRIKFEASDIPMFTHFLSEMSENQPMQIGSEAQKRFLKSQLEAEVDNSPEVFVQFQKAALGCTGMCPFCGARCNSPTECVEGECLHRSDHHRPMAFKGSFEMRDGKKHLLQDYCTSQRNILESKWKKPNDELAETYHWLQRATEMDLDTKGMNLHLEWTTGSDLDIQVMCGCGIWHGYGTEDEGGSGGDCFCETCDMKRDHDVQCGSDNRDPAAIEHVYFGKPQNLVGKRIGMAVHNYENHTSKARNDFKLTLYNKHGFQLFPDWGHATIKQHDWMCTGGDESTSERKFYDYQKTDEDAGKDDFFVGFIQHVKNLQENSNWLFTEADAVEKKHSQEFVAFINRCNKKWAMVKDEICQEYEAEVLEQVLDLNG